MTSGHISVVGASASGLFTAARLASAGRKVTVLERARSLAPEARTLIVTQKMVDFLGPLSDRCVVNRIDRFELFADGKSAEVALSRPDLIIERKALIECLADEADGAGADLVFGARFAELRALPHGADVICRSGDGAESTIGSQVVVGADGARSRVASAAGFKTTPTVSLVQALVEVPEDLDHRTTRVWFRPEDTPYFYWLIPENETRGALGVIGGSAGSVRKHLDDFLAEKGLKALDYQAAVIPAYSGWRGARRRLGGADVYLVGDAGGQVKVSTVGGIVTGFRGAAAVVDAILHNRSRALRSLRLELNTHLLIRRALNAFTEDDYKYLIGGMNRATDRSLQRRDRDEAARALLGYVRARPGVAIRALRALLLAGRGS